MRVWKRSAFDPTPGTSPNSRREDNSARQTKFVFVGTQLCILRKEDGVCRDKACLVRSQRTAPALSLLYHSVRWCESEFGEAF